MIQILSSILTSDEEPPLDQDGGMERLRRRVMAAYVTTPSHEKMYPSAAPSGYFTLSNIHCERTHTLLVSSSMNNAQSTTVLDALHQYYFHLEAVILHAAENHTDSNVLSQIGDDLDEYTAMVYEVCDIINN